MKIQSHVIYILLIIVIGLGSVIAIHEGGTGDHVEGTYEGNATGTLNSTINNGVLTIDHDMTSASSVLLHSFSDDDLIWATGTTLSRPVDVWGRESGGGYLHVEWWVSAGFEGGDTSIAEYDLQVNGELIHNVATATCDSSTVAVGTDGSATNPSRGHGFAKMVCMIPDPLSSVTFDAVNQNSGQVNNIQSGLKVTTLSSFSGETVEIPITGNINGTTTHTENGTVELPPTTIEETTNIENQTNENFTASGTQTIGNLTTNTTGDFNNATISVLELVETIHAANATIETIENVTSQFTGDTNFIELLELMENVSNIEQIDNVETLDNRTQIENFTADSPVINEQNTFGDNLILNQSVGTQNNNNQTVEGDQSVENQEVGTLVTFPESTSSATLDFWLPIGFYVVIAIWSWTRRSTFTALAATIGLLTSFIDLPFTHIVGLLLISLSLWMEYFVGGAFKGPGGGRK